MALGKCEGLYARTGQRSTVGLYQPNSPEGTSMPTTTVSMFNQTLELADTILAELTARPAAINDISDVAGKWAARQILNGRSLPMNAATNTALRGIIRDLNI